MDFASAANDVALKLLKRAEEEEEKAPKECEAGNEYDGKLGLRVSAIFVIMIGSGLGALIPVLARSGSVLKIPSWLFFWAKYFGSGVIVATAFIHLLAPANENLTKECLTGVITEYPWAQGIAMMAVFGLFFVELLAMRYATFTSFTSHDDEPASHSTSSTNVSAPSTVDMEKAAFPSASSMEHAHGHSHSHAHPGVAAGHNPHGHSHDIRLEPHLSHQRDHEDSQDDVAHHEDHGESYAAQLTSLFILEFGVIFHSIFIGLTLAVAGSEFVTLYIVLVFHQTFEGLGLGARLATVTWPRKKRYTPHIMAIAYGLSTPIAIAAGIGARESLRVQGREMLIVNGVFDALSAGILLYTGLVELMAHEFLFSHTLRMGPARDLFLAFFWMMMGALLMAILGKWA